MKLRKIIAALIALLMFPTACMHVHAEDRPFIFDRDTWAFGNTHFMLGNTYRLTPHDHAIMEKTLSHTERRVFDECMSERWQGSCYGFAVTSLLANAGIIDPELYEPNATGIRDVTLKEEAVSLIDYYQQMQCMDEIRNENAWNAYYKTSDERLETLLQLAKEDTPALVSYSGHFDRRKDIYAHAVVAYAFESGDYTWEEKHYDGRIKIYDSNVIVDDYNRYLYIDSQNGNWCIPSYDLYSEEGAQIDLFRADLEFLNNKGLIAGTNFKSDKPPMALLQSCKLNGKYSCTKTSFDEAWHDTQDDAEIKEFCYVFGSMVASDQDFIAPDAESGYCVTVQDEQEPEMTMFYPGKLLYTKGVGQEARFSPDGTVMISSSGQPYTIELVGNEGHYYGSYYDMTLIGTAGTAQLSMTEDGYLLTADQLDAVQITAKSDTGREMLNVATDTNAILFYETDTHHLAAAIDKDGNGSYETVIAEASQLGDLNADGTANSSDAAQLLIAAASIGAGNASGLTETQEKAADVNADGSINASDSAILLQYSAAIGAGSFDGNLELYVVALA